MNSLFLSPHQDDAVLFGCFTLLRERPTVCTVFDDPYGIVEERRREDRKAIVEKLDLKHVGLRAKTGMDAAQVRQHIIAMQGLWGPVGHVYAPAIEPNGHHEHSLVGQLADELWPEMVTHYLTYRRGANERSTDGIEVFEAEDEHLAMKHLALACYISQYAKAKGCREWFVGHQREYYQR